MNNLVIMHDQQAVTTSLILAKAFEKEHSKVIRSIEQKFNEAKNGLVKNMFFESTYLDKKRRAKKNVLPQPRRFHLHCYGLHRT